MQGVSGGGEDWRTESGGATAGLRLAGRGRLGRSTRGAQRAAGARGGWRFAAARGRSSKGGSALQVGVRARRTPAFRRVFLDFFVLWVCCGLYLLSLSCLSPSRVRVPPRCPRCAEPGGGRLSPWGRRVPVRTSECESGLVPRGRVNARLPCAAGVRDFRRTASVSRALRPPSGGLAATSRGGGHVLGGPSPCPGLGAASVWIAGAARAVPAACPSGQGRRGPCPDRSGARYSAGV